MSDQELIRQSDLATSCDGKTVASTAITTSRDNHFTSFTIHFTDGTSVTISADIVFGGNEEHSAEAGIQITA